ncbi:unnamed protein product, partial [Amoebophrya sp. A120]
SYLRLIPYPIPISLEIPKKRCSNVKQCLESASPSHLCCCSSALTRNFTKICFPSSDFWVFPI